MGRRSVSINDIKTPEERGKLVWGWITGNCISEDTRFQIWCYLQNYYLDGSTQQCVDSAEEWKEEEKETKMDTNHTYYNSEAYAQRDYLFRALRNAHYEHEKDSTNKFGLNDDDTPETGTEMIQRFKDGLYVIQKYNPEDPDSGDYIRWRDPNKVTDRAGHREWMKKVQDLREIAEAKIMSLDAAQGLAALNEFKAATPS